jgi:uncharacterized damage-inducible protein DinB
MDSARIGSARILDVHRIESNPSPSERFYSKVRYTSTEGVPHERVVWESMAHLVNHGTQYKTETAAVLTGFGHSPGDIDLIVYLNEAG